MKIAYRGLALHSKSTSPSMIQTHQALIAVFAMRQDYIKRDESGSSGLDQGGWQDGVRPDGLLKLSGIFLSIYPPSNLTLNDLGGRLDPPDITAPKSSLWSISESTWGYTLILVLRRTVGFRECLLKKAWGLWDREMGWCKHVREFPSKSYKSTASTKWKRIHPKNLMDIVGLKPCHDPYEYLVVNNHGDRKSPKGSGCSPFQMAFFMAYIWEWS